MWVTKVASVSDFVHEARSRKHTLLRMASDDPDERRLVRQYAELTPDPPPLVARLAGRLRFPRSTRMVPVDSAGMCGREC
jgi:hypothetical protein